MLKLNTNDFIQSSRISDVNKLNRDLLVYLVWSIGWFGNLLVSDYMFGDKM